MAAHSGFEIGDFRYVDDIANRTYSQAQKPSERFDFDALPMRLEDTAKEESFQRKILQQLIANSKNSRDGIPADFVGFDYCPLVFDYCFVALRKISQDGFRTPYQYSASSVVRWNNWLKFFRLAFR